MPTTQIWGNTQIKGLSIYDAQIATAAAIATSKLADGVLFIKSDGTVNMGANLNMGTPGTNKIINLADPVNPQDAANRQWVLAQMAQVTNSALTARVATTANITLSGAQTIDGVSVVAGNLVLVKNQTTPSQNGVYTCVSGPWTRAAGMDTWPEVPGTIISVQEGTINGDTLWLSVADAGGTINTTSITFTQIPGPSDVQAGAGLTRTGQSIDVVTADNTLQINADSMQVKLDPTRAITVTTSGIGCNVDGTTISIAGNKLQVFPNLYIAGSNYIIRETPGGLVNGSNVTFTLLNAPNPVGSETLFLNGLLQEPGAGNDYTISGATITMAVAPQSTDRLRVNYINRSVAPS